MVWRKLGSRDGKVNGAMEHRPGDSRMKPAGSAKGVVRIARVRGGNGARLAAQFYVAR